MIKVEGSQFQFPFEQPSNTPGRHVYALHFDPVRPRLYAVGTGGGAMWLNLATGATGQVHKIYGYGHLRGERLVSLAISPDGKLLVTGDTQGRLVLWNMELDCLAKKLKHASRVTSLAFSPTDSQLMAAAESREVRLWSLPDYDFGLRDQRGEGGQEATFGPGGEIVERLGSVEQVSVRTRDAATGAQIAHLDLGHVELIMASQSPYLVALPHADRRAIHVYELPSLKRVRELTTERDLLDVAALSGASGMLAVAAGTQRRSRKLDGVEVWDLNTGSRVAAWKPDSENISQLAISATGTWLATADENGTLHAHTLGDALESFPAEPATRKRVATLRPKKEKKKAAEPGWNWTPGLPPGIVLSQIQRHHADALKRARATKNTRTVIPARKKEEAKKRYQRRITEPLNLPEPILPVEEVFIEVAPAEVEAVKRKPGRPRKNSQPEVEQVVEQAAQPALRGRVATPALPAIPRISEPEPFIEPLMIIPPAAAQAPGAAIAAPAAPGGGGMVIRRRKVVEGEAAPAAAAEPEVKKVTLADLDALLAATPSREVWVKLVTMLETWPTPGDLLQDIIPRAARALETWPDELRHTPIHLLSRLEVPYIAAIVALSRVLIWHKAPQNIFFSALGHASLGNITYLDLSYWQISDTLQIRRALEIICGTRHLSNLRVLRLRGCNLDDIEPFTTAAPLDALHVFDISHNALTTELMVQLGQITAMRSLKELDLSSCDIHTKNCKPLGDWTNFARLERLILTGNNLSITGGMILGKAEGFTSLRYLSLRGNAVGHNGMSAIARGSVMTTVQTLDLADNNLGAEGLKALLRSRKVTGFHRLILASNQLDDEAAQILIDSGKRPKFEHLDLSDNRISPAMLAAIDA
jgi:hypothetical protein